MMKLKPWSLEEGNGYLEAPSVRRLFQLPSEPGGHSHSRNNVREVSSEIVLSYAEDFVLHLATTGDTVIFENVQKS